MKSAMRIILSMDCSQVATQENVSSVYENAHPCTLAV